MTLFAAIDMGTGSMRTFYGRLSEQGVPVVEDRKSYGYSLGRDLRQGVFSPERFQEGVETFQQAMADIQARGALLVGAVATEAFRAASNGAAFLQAVEDVSGVRVRLIGGGDELALSYQGAAQFIHALYGDVIFADGGGGSTEVAHIHHQTAKIENWVSLKMGVMTHNHTLCESGIVTPEQVYSLKRVFEEIIVSGCYKNSIDTNGRPLVFAGTPCYLLRLKHGENEQSLSQIPGEELTYAEVKAMVEDVCRLSVSGDLMAQKNLGRPDLLVPTIAKSLALMDVCGVDRFQVVPSGLGIALILQHVQNQAVEVRHVG